MPPRRYIERYLAFLLGHRWRVIFAIAIATLYFAYFTLFHMTVFTNFFDLYPPDHPYIRLYTKYREMFGTANVVLITLEVKDGDLFTKPETIRKVDRITLDLLRNVPGVNGEQVMSITHPKLKTVLTASSGIKVVPLIYPRLPQDAEDLAFLRQKVYATEGVRGFFVSPDDKATLIVAGFWEESFDLAGMWRKIGEIVHREEDDNTKIYVTGFPVLYAYFLLLLPQMTWVLCASIATMIAILWLEFRSWQGVWIPVLSGALSAIWGLGFGGLFGLSLDPLVLVVPLLLSARAHSHSVQSMERYHEEYERLGDRDQAIVKSYTSLYAPAMVSLLADGLAVLTLYVARIPLIQKLAVLSSFWIVSIFISVVTLHPILLSLVKPPERPPKRAPGVFSRLYDRFADLALWLASGRRPVAMAAALLAMLAIGTYDSQLLKVGNATPGEALLYPGHPYNVAFRKANESFVGASQLVVIAEGKKKGALESARTLEQLELFARHMEKQGASGSITPATLLKKIFRTFHEGDPKWSMLPDRDDHVGQLFFLLTSSTRRGELDRFFDASYTNATITLFYREYDHDTIESSIAQAQRYIATLAGPDDTVRYQLAGGLLGILAAVNEEVEWSHRANLGLILAVVFALSYLTYRSLAGALIVMLPSLVAQPMSEAVMYWLGIDLNVNSLPVAAVGIGIGIDYGYYVLSRIVEEYGAEEAGSFESAIARAIRTTGKTVLFTGFSLTASIIYFVFFPMKFQAEMALLLSLLLAFHLIGALLFIPPMVNWIRPRFAVAAIEARRASSLAPGEPTRPRRGHAAN
ncbi:MAG: MMPL family transporter [Candidatus Binatia bacterium]